MMNGTFQTPNINYSSMTSSSKDHMFTLLAANMITVPMKLPDDFEPRAEDILCGRGKGNWNHPGNRRFKSLIEQFVPKYKKVEKKNKKSILIASLVKAIRQQGVLFVKLDSKEKRWYDIGEYQAREKTGHALRDRITERNSGKNNEKTCATNKTTNPKQQSYQRKSKQQSTKFHASNTQQSTKFHESNTQQLTKFHCSIAKHQRTQRTPISASLIFNNQFREIGYNNDITAPRKTNDEPIALQDIFRSQEGLDDLRVFEENEVEPNTSLTVSFLQHTSAKDGQARTTGSVSARTSDIQQKNSHRQCDKQIPSSVSLSEPFLLAENCFTSEFLLQHRSDIQHMSDETIQSFDKLQPLDPIPPEASLPQISRSQDGNGDEYPATAGAKEATIPNIVEEDFIQWSSYFPIDAFDQILP